MSLPSPYALLLLGLLSASTAGAEGARRFAVLVANNEGGEGTRPLRYAHEDARRLRDVFVRLGGVRASDSLLLLDKDAEAVRAAFRAVDALVRREPGAVLVVYYSGHAKDGALRLGDTALPLDEVKAWMSRSGAEVRIGLFDSCRSGTLTRSKGARRAPAFEVESGASAGARGLVLLTSSAADEESQESDELSGSFFSHHLASGLMGGADSSGDGRVSLSEAYAYAYARTVADTVETAAGAQHPTFSYDLAGDGDVVLTDVAQRREGVLLPAESPAGSYYLVDVRGAVAAEIAKVAGAERRVAVAAGTYTVKRRLADRLRLGEIVVPKDGLVVLEERALRDAPFSDDPVKGLSRRHDPPGRWAVSADGGYQRFIRGPFPSMPTLGVELTLRDYLRHDWDLRLDLELGGGRAAVELASEELVYRFSEVGLGVSIIKEWSSGLWAPFAGVRLGAIALDRSFEEARVPRQKYFAMTPGLCGGARLRLGPRWSASVRARLHYLYYDVDTKQSLGYLEGGLQLRYEL